MKKNILVTGVNGFVGRYLVEGLKQQKFNVIGLSSSDGDISQYKFDFNNIDHVIHLAAKTFVPESWKEPYDFYKTNVMGTENVLEFCRNRECSLTFLSTYVYGQPIKSVVGENHPINPNTPYNHSKLLAEELCRFYAHHFKVPVSILRPFNIYGLGQKSRFLIPEIIQQYHDKTTEQIEVMDLRPRRDYLHVKDLVRAIILTINIKSGLNIYNVGSGTSISVEEIIKFILEAGNSKKKYISRKQPRENEVMDLIADITKIKTELKWETQISFKQGIEEMINSFDVKQL